MNTVLYVEDSLASQVLVRRFLKGICEVDTVVCVADAFAMLGKKSYDLVITDYWIGESHTLEFIKQVRARASAQDLPIVALSSSIDRILTTQLFLAGANEAANKPINPKSFSALIKKMLEKPYVRELKDRALRVPCVTWTESGEYFQYCPELDIRVSAQTREAARERMQSEITKQRDEGGALGSVSEATLVTHLIELS